MTSVTAIRFAHRDFEYGQLKAFWREWVSRLTRRCNKLLSLDAVRPLFRGQHYRGWQVIPIDKIVGSEGRTNEFDRAFFPRQTYTQNRWISIATAYYEQIALPPVDLYKINETYFVRDGHHRISVARSQGQEFIDAYVTELVVQTPV